MQLIKAKLKIQNSDEISLRLYSSYSGVYSEIFKSFDKLINFFIERIDDISNTILYVLERCIPNN